MRVKQAYRYLLYQAMLDIRVLCQAREPKSQNPVEWKRKYRASRLAGAIADWLHNLAQHSLYDLSGFDTEAFWQEYESICQRFEQLGPGGFHDYRLRYEEEMVRQDAARQNAAPDVPHSRNSWRQILCSIFPRKPNRF